jgi:hypothetical protein
MRSEVGLLALLIEAIEDDDVAPELKEIGVALSNGKTIRGVEKVEVKRGIVILHTLTERVHVREQDVIAVITP